MKMVVGLGNPGEKYKNTRHNSGFKVIKSLALKHGCSPEKKSSALVAECRIEGARTGLVQPLKLMNRSGRVVGKLARNYQLSSEDFLIVHDDMDLELGRIKLKKSGSSGGHRGVESIIKALETADFSRLRVGIGRPPAGVRPSDYVLTEFSEKELEEVVNPAIDRAVKAAELWRSESCEAAMNRFNQS